MSIGNQFDSWARNHYVGDIGYTGLAELPVGSWIHDDGGTLKQLAAVASGKVGLAYASSGLLCLNWDDTADANQKVVRDWTVPLDYRSDTGKTGERSAILLVLRVRKLDSTGSASDNDDLKLAVTASWHNPAVTNSGSESDGDTAINTLASSVNPETLAGSSLIPTDAAATAEESFRYMVADITEGMTAAQLKALVPGASLTLGIGPNEAIGTDLALEVVSPCVIYTRHLQPSNRYFRDASIRA